MHLCLISKIKTEGIQERGHAQSISNLTLNDKIAG